MRELEPSLGRFAFLTRWHSLHLPCGVCNGPFISPDSNHSSRNSTFSKQHFSPRDDQHGGKPSCPLADRQGGATLARFGGCNFGQTAGPSLIKFGTREGGREGRRGGRGGREGRGGEGREGRGGEERGGEGRGGEGRGGEGEGRGGQGRAGEGRGGEGRGGEGRGGEGRGGEGRGGEGRGGRGGEGRGGEGRGLSTLSTNQNLCDRGA